MKKDILSILDLTKQEFEEVISLAADLKRKRAEGKSDDILSKKVLGMIFEKSSTRTRISFEVGMFELGGHAIFLNPHDMQLGRGEEVKDTARVLSRYLSAIMIRSYYHSTVEEIAGYAAIPVINGLSDKEHPCQILADVLTIKENFGDDLSGIKVAWIGDGNNVCNSLILSSAYTGFEVRVSTPKGYEPDAEIVKAAEKAGAKIKFFESPKDAVKDSHVVYTDTWISMGSEDEKDTRLKAFFGYCVDSELLKNADKNAVVMHCLPAHRGEEISEDVMEGEQSVVWDQAENRLHAQKALLVKLLRK
ncbi:MAG: ornithine carbamoyltransferase [Methanomicrobium sp.]|nr:ornithine carbamoyltransferase [Methanomicrobium sp.]MDD4300693.1 ornithine carbamoyltransferase [Methanomicrobium sp.]